MLKTLGDKDTLGNVYILPTGAEKTVSMIMMMLIMMMMMMMMMMMIREDLGDTPKYQRICFASPLSPPQPPLNKPSRSVKEAHESLLLVL